MRYFELLKQNVERLNTPYNINRGVKYRVMQKNFPKSPELSDMIIEVWRNDTVIFQQYYSYNRHSAIDPNMMVEKCAERILLEMMEMGCELAHIGYEF